MESTTFTYRLTADEKQKLKELSKELTKRSGLRITPAKLLKRAVKEFEKQLMKNESLW